MSNPEIQQTETGSQTLGRWGCLLGCWGCVALIWLVLLPWHSQLRSVEAQQEFWEEQGVDPSVMYYSELENLPLLLSDWKRRHAENPDALWRIPEGGKFSTTEEGR